MGVRQFVDPPRCLYREALQRSRPVLHWWGQTALANIDRYRDQRAVGRLGGKCDDMRARHEQGAMFEQALRRAASA